MEFLYIFNFPPEEEELFKLELKYLFKVESLTKILISSINIPCNTSIYIKAKIDILEKDVSNITLVQKIEKLKLKFVSYKVIYSKNTYSHFGYEDSLVLCNNISKVIEGKNLMREQEITLSVTKVDDVFYFGTYHHGVPDWKHHHNKPYTFSNALDLRLARTIVNVAGQNDFNKTIVDPCCGMGTVVLEGLRLGYSINGYDISREISFKGRKNVEYYGYDGLCVKCCNINELDEKYDVVIIDIPYNLYAPITHQEQCDIISSARRIGDNFILISYDDMDKELLDANFNIIDKCRVKKTMFTNFERKVYVCR